MVERGVEITQPMTAQELAKAVGLHVTGIYQYARQNYLDADRSKRPMLITGGYVPITLNQWRIEMVKATAPKTHMVGFDGPIMFVLDRDRCRVLEVVHSTSRDGIEEQIHRVRGVLGLDHEAT